MQDKNLNIYKDFISNLKNHLKIYTDDALAKKLNVSPSAVAQWYKRGVPQRFMIEYDQIISGAGEKVAVDDRPININAGEEKVDVQAKYIIELQKDKIDNQASQIKTLQRDLQNKQIESTHWDALEYDFISDVTLIRNKWKFGRVVNNITDIKKQSEVLGYSVDYLTELWNVGKRYKRIQDHPIDAIISHETSKSITTQLKTLPALFDTILKSMVGDHYIPQPIIYNHKDGHKIGAVAFCKVTWSNYNIIAKVQFLTD